MQLINKILTIFVLLAAFIFATSNCIADNTNVYFEKYHPQQVKKLGTATIDLLKSIMNEHNIEYNRTYFAYNFDSDNIVIYGYYKSQYSIGYIDLKKRKIYFFQSPKFFNQISALMANEYYLHFFNIKDSNLNASYSWFIETRGNSSQYLLEVFTKTSNKFIKCLSITNDNADGDLCHYIDNRLKNKNFIDLNGDGIDEIVVKRIYRFKNIRLDTPATVYTIDIYKKFGNTYIKANKEFQLFILEYIAEAQRISLENCKKIEPDYPNSYMQGRIDINNALILHLISKIQ